MIRTIVIPHTKTVFFDVPADYIGKELEVIAFQKEEGMTKETPKKSMADFWGTISDETANKLHKEVEQSRNEWEQRLNKQF